MRKSNFIIPIIFILSLSMVYSLTYYENMCWTLSNGNVCINGTTSVNTFQGVKINWSDILNPVIGSGSGTDNTSILLFLNNNTIIRNQNTSWITENQRVNTSAEIRNTLSAGANLTYNSANGIFSLNVSSIKTYFDSLYQTAGSYLTTLTSFAGHVTGTYNSIEVVNTAGLSTTNITSGEFTDTRISNNLTINTTSVITANTGINITDGTKTYQLKVESGNLIIRLA